MSRAVLLLMAGCGRIAFDSPPPLDDAGLDGLLDVAPLPRPELVQSGSANGGMTMANALIPTREGSLLVVATMNFNPGGVVAPTSAVTDDAGNTYVSANSRALWSGNQGAVEIWYASNAQGGATAVTVESAAFTTRSTWILELANMDPSIPLDVVGAISDGPDSATPTAPAVTPSRAPAVVISGILLSGFVTQINASSDFITLPIIDGDAVAYLITDQLGTYATVWDAPGSGNYASSTVAFVGLAAD